MQLPTLTNSTKQIFLGFLIAKFRLFLGPESPRFYLRFQQQPKNRRSISKGLGNSDVDAGRSTIPLVEHNRNGWLVYLQNIRIHVRLAQPKGLSMTEKGAKRH
jgi:hypothetical protein